MAGGQGDGERIAALLEVVAAQARAGAVVALTLSTLSPDGSGATHFAGVFRGWTLRPVHVPPLDDEGRDAG